MLQSHTYDDVTLVACLHDGNLQAFDTLYWKYHKALYANALKITRDTGAAEDIVQETFITLWQKRMSIQAERSVSGWLFVINYNKAISWQKRQLLQAKASEMIAVTEDQEDELSDKYTLQKELLQDAMEQLSPQKRRVFELCKLQGKSYKETAATLNISSHTVKEYLSGAMASVKEYAISHPEYHLVLPVLALVSA